MFRIAVQSERLWRSARKIAILGKLIRVDMRAIATMQNAENIDQAFSEIDLLSGVSKQTNKNRFADIDKLSAGIIADRSLSKVHDVGVSSGITSLELLRQLRAASFSGKFLISDKFACFWAIRRGLSTDIYDAEQKLVCSYFGLIVGDRDDTWKLPVSKLVFRRAMQRNYDSDGATKFLLLHPEVLAAIDRGELDFIDFDVFGCDEKNTFDFVRCMNLLNLGYFSKEQILTALKALHTSLVAGGVIQIGRTHLEGGNHVTYYEKTSDGFLRLESLGEGSEIEHLVVEFNDSQSVSRAGQAI